MFHTWCIDFGGTLPRTNDGNQHLILAAEQRSKWPVAWAIPADSYNSIGVTEFAEKEIIMLFSPPQYILSNDELKFDSEEVHDFARRFNIHWKYTSTYNP